MLMKKFWGGSHVRVWLAIVGSATLILGAAYAMVQQATRLAANDAPLIKAQALKDQLAQNSSSQSLVSDEKINPDQNYGIFTIITDKDGYLQASDLSIDGKTPLPPKGVLDYTKTHRQDNITWQPTSGVRLATHVESYTTNNQPAGFIITGQSLKPFEDRIGTYTALAAAAWVAVLGWTTLTLLIPVAKK